MDTIVTKCVIRIDTTTGIPTMTTRTTMDQRGTGVIIVEWKMIMTMI